MAEMSRQFNFDDFDALVAEALEEHRTQDSIMAQEGRELDERQRWEGRKLRPGEIGGVACSPSFFSPEIT